MLGEDAYFNVRIDAAESVEAPIVFAGYGLTVPELKYDDLAGQDLQGKVALIVSGSPSSIPGPLSSHYQSAGERWKSLKKAGAIGAITVQNPKNMDIPWARSARARLQPALDLADPALDETAGQKLSVIANPAHIEKFFAGSGHTFAEILKFADARKQVPRFPLATAVRATLNVQRSEAESPNVCGILPGSDPSLNNEYVVLSAHLDHLGIGEPVLGDRIFNGAMDDASGVASLLEMAQQARETKKNFRRSLLFLAVTGEESGLLGSKYFAAYPTVKIQSIVADLNIDMFLPLFPLKRLTVMGLRESDLGERVREAAGHLGIGVQEDPEPQRNLFIRSDQYSFIRRGVPALAFKIGYEKGSPEEAVSKKWLKERYHALSDDLTQPVDLKAAADFNRLILSLAESVANREARPKWNPDSFFRRFERS